MYQSALEIEFHAQGLRFRREAPITVLYRDREIGRFRTDFVVDDLIVVETKAISALAKADYRQLLNYLYASTNEVGLLLNFGTVRLEHERKLYTNDRKVWLTSKPHMTGGKPEISGMPIPPNGLNPPASAEGQSRPEKTA